MYVGTTAKDLFKESVNHKQATSTQQFTLTTTAQYYSSFPNFAGYSINTSATKHMDQDIVTDVHNRIKNYGDGSNLRVYSSSVKPDNKMYVIDIKSDLGGMVNRHLGNFLDGSIIRDPNIKGSRIIVVVDWK